ncbi:AKAP7 2'5' RNA ligase-like domain-containing protein [Russula compacta]|nr:AKAP7 2'5' RNA ligase-like domain-containing protein [Russula compacta]
MMILYLALSSPSVPFVPRPCLPSPYLMAIRPLFLTLSHKPTPLTPSSLTAMIPSPSPYPNRSRPSTTDTNTNKTRQSRPSTKKERPGPGPGPKPKPNPQPPRPTHFLALPIGHHAGLRDAIAALTSSWLAHEPPIEGLDPSIVVHPRRLHFTLGVMALKDIPPPPPQSSDRDRDRGHGHDLAGATALLASLAPRVRALLAHNDPLRVPLGRLAVMQPDPARAHVLYVEPDLRSPDGQRLRAVCDLVRGAFKEAGFLADAQRPLKLHCTILNTKYRRRTPSQGQRRGAAAGSIPFSFAAFPPTTANDTEGENLGTWSADELQICKMGSWAPDGAYVRVAGCDLRPAPGPL